MQPYIALLRGINVGGKHRVAMASLQKVYQCVGSHNVRTLLQTGNVLFEHPEADPAVLRATLEAACYKAFGFLSQTLLFEPEAFRTVLQQAPFSDVEHPELSRRMVIFLAQAPAESSQKALQEALLDHSAPEVVWVRGQAAYVYYPHGAGQSKLTLAVIEKKLGVAGTARNWNTVSKLREALLGF